MVIGSGTKGEMMNGKAKNIIGFLIGVIIGIVMWAVMINMQSNAKVKYKKIPLGVQRASAYCPATNTPRGSRATASGKRATRKRTIAVDRYNPIADYGDKLLINGVVYTVEDCGNLGRYGRSLDIFFDTYSEVTEWGVRSVKVCKLVKVKKTKEDRKEEARQGWFLLYYDPTLAPWEIKVDKKVAKGGTIQIGYNYYDVRPTKNLGRVLKTGNRSAIYTRLVKIDGIFEEAVG